MTAQHEHQLLTGALRVRAEQYAAGLSVGDAIEPYDRVYLAGTGWVQYLDEALAARDLMIEGDTVVPLLRMAAAE